MLTKIDKRQRRQAACQDRARSSRFYAKVLIPVAMITMSTALWSDPVLGPKLAQGLEEVKPVLAKYAQNTPLEDAFGPVPEPQAEEIASETTAENADGSETEEAALALTSNLPTSVRPVNRP